MSWQIIINIKLYYLKISRDNKSIVHMVYVVLGVQGCVLTSGPIDIKYIYCIYFTNFISTEAAPIHPISLLVPGIDIKP